MAKAVIFDFFGVVYTGMPAGVDAALLEYITGLKRRYKTALLSNAVSLDGYIDASLLDAHFDVVAVSEAIGYAKPDPAAYGYVLDRLGVQPHDAVFIDDIADYCRAAERLGIRAIHYTGLAALKRELDTVSADPDK